MVEMMDRKLIEMKAVLRKKYGKAADAMHLYKFESYTIYKLVFKMLFEIKRIENIESPYHGEPTAIVPRYLFDAPLDANAFKGVSTQKEGVYYTSIPQSEHKVVCPKCKGLGHHYSQVCPRCEGTRLLFRKRILEQRFYYETQDQWILPLALMRNLPERYVKPLAYDTKSSRHFELTGEEALSQILDDLVFDVSYLKEILWNPYTQDLHASGRLCGTEMILFPTTVQHVHLIEKYETKEVFIQDYKTVIWFPDF